MRTLAFAVMLLLFALDARAQSREDLSTIDAWLLGGSQNEAQKEAAVVKLLESKPAVAKGRKDGQPLLVYALDSAGVAGDIGRRARKLAELLIAKGADVNARVANAGEKVPRMPLLAKYAMFARIDAIKILLAKGADPNAGDADQRTALHWLATLQELEKDARLVQQWLAATALVLDGKRARIDARDRWGKTPLAITAFLGNKRMTELLLARGADLNAKDKDGYSVLGVCRLRVDSGPKKPTFANPKEKDATREVIKLLVAKGAKDERPR
jgi:hypothetical protein